MFDRTKEIFVQSVGILAGEVLVFKPFTLLDWIVQLAIRIPDFHACNEGLEPFDQPRIRPVPFRQRTDFHWMVDHEHRPKDFRFDESLEYPDERFPPTAILDARIDPPVF